MKFIIKLFSLNILKWSEKSLNESILAKKWRFNVKYSLMWFHSHYEWSCTHQFNEGSNDMGVPFTKVALEVTISLNEPCNGMSFHYNTKHIVIKKYILHRCTPNRRERNTILQNGQYTCGLMISMINYYVVQVFDLIICLMDWFLLYIWFKSLKCHKYIKVE